MRAAPAAPAAASAHRKPPTRGPWHCRFPVPDVAQDLVTLGTDLWALDAELRVLRIDGRSNRVTARVAAIEAIALAAAGDAVWALAGDGTVARIDARSARVTRRVRVTGTGVSASPSAAARSGSPTPTTAWSGGSTCAPV